MEDRTRVKAGLEAQLEKFAAEDKAISVEIQGFEARIKEAEAKLKDREKEKLGSKATLAAMEIELQSTAQQVFAANFSLSPVIGRDLRPSARACRRRHQKQNLGN